MPRAYAPIPLQNRGLQLNLQIAVYFHFKLFMQRRV